MSIYARKVDELPDRWRDELTIVHDVASLHARIAREFGDLLEAKSAAGEILTMIAPVGPLDYTLFAREITERRLDARYLRVVNMDEYLTDTGEWIEYGHPLSFRRFMDETFYDLLPPDNTVPENQRVFPDPADPGGVTELLNTMGGADVCWAGFGITGHLAFNDPPEMLGEATELEAFRNCTTRHVLVSPMATAQMAMGGTDGVLDIIPRQAITIGMQELLAVKRFHLTFMRSWHAGLWRRALFGEVSSSFPGSLIQLHPNVGITMTAQAAAVPRTNTSQETGEQAPAPGTSA